MQGIFPLVRKLVLTSFDDVAFLQDLPPRAANAAKMNKSAADSMQESAGQMQERFIVSIFSQQLSSLFLGRQKCTCDSH
jgi:hypothetical protein